MKNFSLSISGETLKLDCFALLDAGASQGLLAAVKEALTGAKVTQVLVLTNSVTDIPEAGKKELVALQRLLCDGRRTAWVDERARFRGVALWVMHLAGDTNGKAVSTLAQAEAWLKSSEARESLGQRTVKA
jgi:hypothetical protein